jgi:hypothetical protein
MTGLRDKSMSGYSYTIFMLSECYTPSMPLLPVDWTGLGKYSTHARNEYAPHANEYLVLTDLFLTQTTEHFLDELGRLLFMTPPVAVPPIHPSIPSSLHPHLL